MQAVTEEAMIMAQAQVAEGQCFLVLYQEDWHEGILGIVASRIVESYQRPTMILNIDHEKQHAKGSARSISQISMFELLSTQADLIDKFGGHHAAAGLTLPIENVESLKQALNEVMKNQYKEDALQPEKYIDAAVALDTVTVENIASLERLRPFGMQFERPLFQLNHLTIQQARAIGQQQNHLKISFVEQKLQGLFWNEGSRIHEIMPNQHINAIGELQINEWNGNRTPQLIVTDIHSNERQMFDYRSKNKKLPQFETTSNTCYLIHPSSDKRNQHEYYYGEPIPNDYEKCVFLELPLTIDDFKESLQHISASQVYVQFTHQKSIYFEGLPKIDTFKKCYKLLYQQKEIDLTKKGLNMSRFLQIEPQLLKFILKVFLDLQFITQNNGIIKIDTTATKQDITSSRIYQGRLHRIEVEKQLLYSDFPALQQWMENAMQEEE